MRADQWHDCSRAKSDTCVAFASGKVQVRDSRASSALGDLHMAQLLLGTTAVVPVVPPCQVSRGVGITGRWVR